MVLRHGGTHRGQLIEWDYERVTITDCIRMYDYRGVMVLV
jgi:hypothetical protein